jgi:hypothetical protein
MKSKLLSAAFLSAFAYSANATVYTVSNVPNSIGQYNTITAAMLAATAGDTIYVNPSNVSYGAVTINKAVVLIGAGAWPEGQSGQRSTVSSVSLVALGNGATFKGFELSSWSTSGVITNFTFEFNRLTSTISFGGATSNVIIRNNMFSVGSTAMISSSQVCTNILISNNIFRNTAATGNILTLSNTSNNGNLFSNNIIHSTVSTGNPLRGASNFTVINNIIHGGASTVAADAIQNCNISHNLFFGNYSQAGVFAITSNGANNLFGTSFDPVFTEISQINNLWAYAPTAPFTDLSLPINSPAIGSGTGGSDMGIYTGSSPWMDNPAGAARTYYPGARIPEIYEFVSPGVAAPNSTMQIQIKARNAN